VEVATVGVTRIHDTMRMASPPSVETTGESLMSMSPILDCPKDRLTKNMERLWRFPGFPSRLMSRFVLCANNYPKYGCFAKEYLLQRLVLGAIISP
jgi:hypothetical protein